jgi:hypothetical protein
MSAKAENVGLRERHVMAYVMALLITLATGATIGSLITREVTSTPTIAEHQTVGIAPWDQQKLDAMDGRQAAARIHETGLGILPWDPRKLEAMEGFQASAGEP